MVDISRRACTKSSTREQAKSNWLRPASGPRAWEVRVVWYVKNPRWKGADEEEVRGAGVDGADEAVCGAATRGGKASKRETHPLNPRKLSVPVPLDPVPVPASGISPSPPSPVSVPVPFIVSPSVSVSPPYSSSPYSYSTRPTPIPPTPPPAVPYNVRVQSGAGRNSHRPEPHARAEHGEERVGVELGEGRSKRKFLFWVSLVWGGMGKRREEEEEVGMGGEGGWGGRASGEGSGGERGRGREEAEEQGTEGGRRKGGGCRERDVGHGMRAPNNNHKREGKTHRKHHKTNHVEGAEDRAVGERVSEYCVVIVSRRSGSERLSVGGEKGEHNEGETHVTSPVWIVAGGAERQNRRKIDRRAIALSGKRRVTHTRWMSGSKAIRVVGARSRYSSVRKGGAVGW
ncbi:hypothetical protein B0H13DRAFT_1912404 [Mycena leptocephala]|nr:hypothetical protein B0H13DRAFT_1912404 [Mycena leptocephala]